MTQDNNVQKRAYYRMDVIIPMAYRVLTEEEAMVPLPATADTMFIESYFSTELNEINARIENTITKIAEKSSIMAAALRAINDKLDVIAHSLGEDAIKHVMPTIPVNISAGGLSFNSSQNMAADAMVDLLLVLNNREDPILVRSQVVKLIPYPDGTSMAALEFKNLTEEARRQIVYFIQTKEIELAREKRGG